MSHSFFYVFIAKLIYLNLLMLIFIYLTKILLSSNQSRGICFQIPALLTMITSFERRIVSIRYYIKLRLLESTLTRIEIETTNSLFYVICLTSLH